MTKKKKEKWQYLSPYEKSYMQVVSEQEEAAKQRQAFEQKRSERSFFGSIFPKTRNITVKKNKAEKFNMPKKVIVAPSLSREQQIISEVFGGGEPTFGTGENLPKINHTLTSGQLGDDGTAEVFGFDRKKRFGFQSETGEMFGI